MNINWFIIDLLIPHMGIKRGELMAGQLDVKDDIMRRLKKIEGQVKGIQRMIDEEKYCVDILTQVAAVKAAINKVGTMVFENHTRQCLKKSVNESNEDDMIKDIIGLLVKFTK